MVAFGHLDREIDGLWRSLVAHLTGEVAPGDEVQTPEDAIRWASSPGMTIAHAVGSAAMGNSDDDVVDTDLRVRGVDGLRVVDISVLPLQVSGNTASTAMALGWLAGDLFRDQR